MFREASIKSGYFKLILLMVQLIHKETLKLNIKSRPTCTCKVESEHIDKISHPHKTSLYKKIKIKYSLCDYVVQFLSVLSLCVETVHGVHTGVAVEWFIVIPTVVFYIHIR